MKKLLKIKLTILLNLCWIPLFLNNSQVSIQPVKPDNAKEDESSENFVSKYKSAIIGSGIGAASGITSGVLGASIGTNQKTDEEKPRNAEEILKTLQFKEKLKENLIKNNTEQYEKLKIILKDKFKITETRKTNINGNDDFDLTDYIAMADIQKINRNCQINIRKIISSYIDEDNSNEEKFEAMKRSFNSHLMNPYRDIINFWEPNCNVDYSSSEFSLTNRYRYMDISPVDVKEYLTNTNIPQENINEFASDYPLQKLLQINLQLTSSCSFLNDYSSLMTPNLEKLKDAKSIQVEFEKCLDTNSIKKFIVSVVDGYKKTVQAMETILKSQENLELKNLAKEKLFESSKNSGYTIAQAFWKKSPDLTKKLNASPFGVIQNDGTEIRIREDLMTPAIQKILEDIHKTSMPIPYSNPSEFKKHFLKMTADAIPENKTLSVNPKISKPEVEDLIKKNKEEEKKSVVKQQEEKNKIQEKVQAQLEVQKNEIEEKDKIIDQIRAKVEASPQINNDHIDYLNSGIPGLIKNLQDRVEALEKQKA
jgi:hypothetical protein